MSKRASHKTRRLPGKPRPAARPAAPAGPPDGLMLRLTRLACYAGFPALLVLSPNWFYMQGMLLGSENSIYQWSVAEMMAVVVTTLWLVAIAVGHVPHLRFHWVDAALAGFFLISLVASLLVPYHFDSSRRLKEMLAGVAVFFVVKGAFVTERDQRTLVRVFMGMLGLVAVVGVVHYLWYVMGNHLFDMNGREIWFLSTNLHPDAAPWEKDFGVRAASFLGNPNFLASALLVLVPIGLAGLVMHRRPHIGPVALGAAVVWVIVAALLLWGAAEENGRLTELGDKLDAARESAQTTPAEWNAVGTQLKSAQTNMLGWANWVKVWALIGVGGVVAALVFEPFFGMAVAVVLGFALLLFTNSWAGFSGMLAGLVFLAIMIRVKQPARFRPQTAIGLGVALGAALIGFFVVKAASQSYIIPPREARTGLRAREILWDTVPQMVRERPILGFGAESFFTYCNKYMSRILPGPSRYERMLVLNPRAFIRPPGGQAPKRLTLLPERYPPPGTVSLLVPGKGERLVTEKHAQTFINNPNFIERNPGRVHGEYLAVLVETGVVGLAVFVALFVLFYTGSLAWPRGEDSWRSVVLLGATTAITAIAVMQAVDFPYRLPEASMLISATFALATAWHRGRGVKVPRALPVAAKAGLALLVAAAGVYLFMTTVQHARSLQVFNSARRELAKRRIPTDEVFKIYEDVYARRPLDHNLYFALPEMALYLDRLGKAAEYLRALEQVQPFHEKVQLLWGHYYRKTGDLVRAIDHYRRAIELEPRNFTARVFLTETLVRANELEEAKAALAQAWLWEDETTARMRRVRSGSSLTKRENRMVLVHMPDLYWPWIMNAEAMVRALEGDFDGARAMWRAAMARWRAERASLREVDQGAYGLYPEIPIFALNLSLLAQTTPEEVAANRTQWAAAFRGAADYETFKRLDDRYRMSLAWNEPTPPGPEDIVQLAQTAIDALDQIAHSERLGPKVLTLDGNMGRAYHIRRGLQMLRAGRGNDAMTEFELGTETEAAEVARANIAVVRTMTPQSMPSLRLVDEHVYADMLLRIDPRQHESLATYIEDLRALSAIYSNFDFVPLVSGQIAGRMSQGDREGAGWQFLMLEQLYPGDSRVAQLRAMLGL
ncbi:MAG: tetratricopeptide repeat protein [Verrucomicrobia bacterium]|nr:tetratricopeptide repeat protein [Verrucomicrobiota bacterium]